MEINKQNANINPIIENLIILYTASYALIGFCEIYIAIILQKINILLINILILFGYYHFSNFIIDVNKNYNNYLIILSMLLIKSFFSFNINYDINLLIIFELIGICINYFSIKLIMNYNNIKS